MTQERIVQVEGKFGSYRAELSVELPAESDARLIRVGFLGAMDSIKYVRTPGGLNVTLWNATLDPFRSRGLVSVAVVSPTADWQHQPEPQRIWCEFLLP